MTPDDIRRHATEILLDHTRDIEMLTISEHLMELELPMAEHDAACEAVDEAISAARVTVEWPKEASDR